MKTNRLYILIKDDLKLSYQGVQGGHAVAQYLLENPNQTWNNNYLIYLQVKNLDLWKMKLNDKNIQFTEFKEPDLDNETTAIAVKHDGSIFKNLRLIGD